MWVLRTRKNKHVLGFAEATTENAEVVAGLLQDVIGCGLRYEGGLLVVIDGARGLRKAVEDIFGDHAQVHMAQAGECGGASQEQSLQTTNIIENINSHLGRRTRRVTRRVNSDQRQRWVAMAIQETEPRLHTLPCAEHLPKPQKIVCVR